MKIAVLGFGAEGKTTLKFLKKSPRFKKADIYVLDKKNDANYLKNLGQFDIVFRSPGVPYNLPEIQKAAKAGIKFSGNIQLFFEEAEKIGCQIIGVTGTKGKGTVSTLLYKTLKAAGRDAHLAGNIGKPAIGILPQLNKNSLVVLELSSFQLQDLNPPAGKPDIAVVLDISPDHLDVHKNFREYLDAKTSIVKKQKKTGKVFYFTGNAYSKRIAQKSPAKKIIVSSEKFKLFKPEDLKIPGAHNFKNAVMAAEIALTLNCPKSAVVNTIKKFKGNKHRLEFTGKIGGINFYNDSAGTNPQTAIAAIRAFKEPKILIAGGKDKNLNYFPLAKAVKNSNTKLVVLFGENKTKIAKALKKNKNKELKINKVKDLKTAVDTAYKAAKFLTHNSKSVIYVLFSPASASFGMFKNYKERGEKFKEIVRKLR